MHIHNVRLQLIHMGKLCSAQVALVRILRHYSASAGLRLCSASIPPLYTDNGSGFADGARTEWSFDAAVDQFVFVHVHDGLSADVTLLQL